MRLKHECGGSAHFTNNKMAAGWNQCVCNRCGKVYYIWVTQEMLKLRRDEQGKYVVFIPFIIEFY